MMALGLLQEDVIPHSLFAKQTVFSVALTLYWNGLCVRVPCRAPTKDDHQLIEPPFGGNYSVRRSRPTTLERRSALRFAIK
jgi:hypothetical protein